MSELTVLICASLSGVILWIAFKKKTRELSSEQKRLDGIRSLIGMHLTDKNPGGLLLTITDFQDELNLMAERASMNIGLTLTITTPMETRTLTPTDETVR